MSDLATILNEPIEVTIAGRTLSFRSPKLKDILAKVGKQIKQAEIQASVDAADQMELEGPERAVFLREAYAQVSKGRSLQGQIWSYLGTPEGCADVLFAAAKGLNEGLELEDVLKYVMGGQDEAIAWAEYLIGSPKKKLQNDLEEIEALQDLAERKRIERIQKAKSPISTGEPSEPSSSAAANPSTPSES